jgi:hypothetical protein
MRRAVTSWNQLVLEPPTSMTAYVAPLVAGGITLALLLLLVVRVRSAPAPQPRAKELGSLGQTEPSHGLPDVPEHERLGAVGVLSAMVMTGLFVYLLVVGVGAVLARAAESEKDAASRGRDTEVLKLKEKQSQEIDAYEWVDEKTGKVKIPVERAMDLVVDDARQGKQTLVPAVGPHDKPTMPAKFGRDQPAPAAPAPAAGQPATAPASTAPAAPAPASGQPAAGQPAQPPAGQPAQPPAGQPAQPPAGQPAPKPATPP